MIKIIVAVGNIIQQKRRRAIDRIRSMTSEADEATDIEPNYLLQDSLTQIDLKEVDDDNDVVLASTIVKKYDEYMNKCNMFFFFLSDMKCN